MLCGKLYDFLQTVEIDILDFAETDTAFSNAYITEIFFILFSHVFFSIDRAYIQADVIFLIGEGDRRPGDRLMFVVSVRKAAVAEHVIGKVRLETRRRLFDQLVKKTDDLFSIRGQGGHITLDAVSFGFLEHVHIESIIQ